MSASSSSITRIIPRSALSDLETAAAVSQRRPRYLPNNPPTKNTSFGFRLPVPAPAQALPVRRRIASVLSRGSRLADLAQSSVPMLSLPLRVALLAPRGSPGPSVGPFARQSCRRCKTSPLLGTARRVVAGRTYRRNQETIRLLRSFARSWPLPPRCECPPQAQCSSPPQPPVPESPRPLAAA